MNAPADIHDLVAKLKSEGEPFAIATVVRTVAVTSAKAGAKAIIRSDGTITEGWIGGGCARGAVLKAAREAIEDDAPRLVSVQPEDLLDEQGVAPGDVKDGVKYARNMCPSQGTMDIFVEAVRPKPELVIMGASPVAVALAALAKPLGFSRTICASPADHNAFDDAEVRTDGFDIPDRNGRRFIVISTQGRGDEAALRAAVKTNADYRAFVGSARKAASLKLKLQARGIEETLFDGLKAPAGLNIKAITPEEIALSILAEIVEYRRTSDRDKATLIKDLTEPAQTET
ncbi:MAG: XdhC family protein [Pseudomonadota bacterium]